MFQIPGELLWLGNTGDVRDLRHLFGAGITAVVDLALNDAPPPIPHELIWCRIPLVDGAGNIPGLVRLAIQTAVTLLEAKMPTLVYCSIGLSRGPAIAAAALAVRDGSHLEESLRRIADVHRLDVSPGLWQEVKEAAEKLQAVKPGH